MSENGINRDYLSHRLLRVLSKRLNTYGMQTRESRHGEEVVEIAATNPRDPDKGGRVMIGYEGYLIWECWAEFKSESDAITAADVVYALLTQDLTCAPLRSRSGCALPETPGPRRSGFGAGRTQPRRPDPATGSEEDAVRNTWN